ncbi:MAG: tetratricopeptide repeat protein [Acetatifactor sp.]
MKKILFGLAVAGIAAVMMLTVVFQRYIYHYNRGNGFYESGQYEKAAAEYEKALNCHIAHRKECNIRINTALAMVAPLDFKNTTKLSKKERKEYINILEDAVDVLVEEGCAHKNNQDGHDEDAQQLKDELQEIIEELEREKPEEEKPDNEEDDPDEPEITKKQQQQLEEIIRQGTGEHIKEMEEYRQLKDYEYYDGNCW